MAGRHSRFNGANGWRALKAQQAIADALDATKQQQVERCAIDARVNMQNILKELNHPKVQSLADMRKIHAIAKNATTYNNESTLQFLMNTYGEKIIKLALSPENEAVLAPDSNSTNA